MDNRTGLQMTTEQYCRINRYALNMLMAIQIIMGLMSIIHMATTGFSWKDLVLILVMAGAVIADFAGYMLMKESKTTMIFYSIVWMIAYSMAVFLGPVNPIMCLFPVLVVMMLYLDPVAVAASILYSLLVHIIKLIVEAASGRITGENVSSYILDCIGLVAICIGAFFVTKLLLKYIRESQAQVTEQAAQQMEISASVQETAEVIGRRFGEITNQLEEIVGQLESNNLAITNIAESTEATAEAVQEQAVMTRDISECIDTTAQNANDIIDTTDQLYDVVGEGIEAVEGLQEQTEMVNEQTNETSEALRKLADNVDEVNSITQTIRDISSQTNLLALNASIEAARAGDAGRGFAVVADEIRNLADQTKKSTEQITIIINDLTAVTRESMSKLQVTVDSVHVQTEMVEKVNVTFMETCKSIDELKDYTGSISDNVDTVIDANKHIIDSISQLSAGTEEVSSASQEGMAVSNVILEQMQDFASSVEEMSELVEQLAGSVSGSDFETIPVYEGIEEPEVYEDAKDSETYEDAEEPEAYRDEAEAAVYDEDAEEPEAYEDEAETAVYDEDAEEPEAYEDEAETAVYDEDAEEPEVYEDEAVSYDENVEESEAYEDVEDSETYEDTETEW